MKKKYVILALFIALSIVLSYVVIPSISGTIAFDSTPSYFAALYLSPVDGGVVGFFAHMLSAMLKGFPLGLPIHVLVASTMFLSVVCYGYSYNKFGSKIAILVATIMNGVVSLIPFIWIINIEFFLAMIIPLTIASFVNASIGTFVYFRIKGHKA